MDWSSLSIGCVIGYLFFPVSIHLLSVINMWWGRIAVVKERNEFIRKNFVDRCHKKLAFKEVSLYCGDYNHDNLACILPIKSVPTLAEAGIKETPCGSALKMKFRFEEKGRVKESDVFWIELGLANKMRYGEIFDFDDYYACELEEKRNKQLSDRVIAMPI